MKLTITSGIKGNCVSPQDSPGGAFTYYVDPDSVADPEDGSIGSPFKNITFALHKATQLSYQYTNPSVTLMLDPAKEYHIQHSHETSLHYPDINHASYMMSLTIKSLTPGSKVKVFHHLGLKYRFYITTDLTIEDIEFDFSKHSDNKCWYDPVADQFFDE